MKKYSFYLFVFIISLSVMSCSGPDYTDDNAMDLCEYMNIDTNTPAYPSCFTITSQIYNTYPHLDIQALIDQVDHICDDAGLDHGDNGYPTCFMRTSIPLVEKQNIAPENWQTAMQKIILIEKNYNGVR
jgi:hypothetical protein